MPKFSYQAFDAQDQPVAGEIEAASLSEAIRLLDADQISVQSIEQLEAIAEPPQASFDRDGQSTSLLEPLRQSLEHYEPLISGLQAFAAEVPATRWSGQLPALIESIRGGTNAEQILSDYPAWVPLLVSSAGSSSKRNLADSLEQAAYHRATESRAWRFMVYPLLILALAFGVLLLLSVLIIPEFSSMYKEFGLRLPVPTLALLQFSDRLVESPVVVLGIAALVMISLVALIWTWRRNNLAYRLLERISASERADSLACLTSQVASLLDAGVSLNEALDVSARSDLHPHYQAAARTLVYHVASQSAVPRGLLPPNVIFAMGIGRDSSPNVPMLHELARSYRQRGHEQIEGWHGIAGAFSIIAVGVVVGWVVLALFMPMVSLISGLAG